MKMKEITFKKRVFDLIETLKEIEAMGDEELSLFARKVAREAING